MIDAWTAYPSPRVTEGWDSFCVPGYRYKNGEFFLTDEQESLLARRRQRLLDAERYRRFVERFYDSLKMIVGFLHEIEIKKKEEEKMIKNILIPIQDDEF